MDIIKLAISLAIPSFTALIAYYFSKKKDREAELRKEKLRYYKNFSSCLARIIEGEHTSKDQIAFSHAATQLNLVASSNVIYASNKYMRIIEEPVSTRNKKEYLEAQSNLFRNIRLDLGLKDHDVNLTFFLWPSGIQSESSPNNLG